MIKLPKTQKSMPMKKLCVKKFCMELVFELGKQCSLIGILKIILSEDYLDFMYNFKYISSFCNNYFFYDRNIMIIFYKQLSRIYLRSI